MKQHKLLICWDGQPIIAHLLNSIYRCEFNLKAAVLCRSDDIELQRLVQKWPGAELVVPEAPPQEMRDSVELLVDSLNASQPGGWMLIPADHPIVEQQVLDRLISAWRQHPEKIVVPVHEGRRGHPTIFPASFPNDIRRIPAGNGVNWLLRSCAADAIHEVDCPEPSVLFDLDTPDDLAKLQQIQTQSGRQQADDLSR